MTRITSVFQKTKFFILMALTFLMTPSAAMAETLGVAKKWQLGYQDAASPTMHKMVEFHDLLMIIITAISVLVLLLLIYVVLRFNKKANPKPSKTTHNTMLEVVWTLIPVLLLVIIVIPSLKLLYFADRTVDAEMTLKVTGYQWYWGYEYPDQGNISFNSYMIPDDEIKEGQFRLLETDNRVIVPVNTNVRLLVTSADVIHSWAIPAFGVKIDAVPGRFNETWFNVEKEGVYFGQCSELCGKDHGFMPIAIEAVSKEAFEAWTKEAQEEFSNLKIKQKYKLAYAGE